MAFGTLALWGALAPIITGGAAAAATVHGSRAASQANREALDVQRAGTDQAIAFEREVFDYDRGRQDRLDAIDLDRYARDQARIDRLEGEDSRRWDASDARATRDENFTRAKFNLNAPYRATGKAALGELAKLAGLEVGDLAGEQVAMVPGGTPPAARPSAPSAVAAPAARASTDPMGMPAPGDDGLVEMTMSADAYKQLSAGVTPAPQPRPMRRPVRSLLPQAVGA